MTDNIKYNVNCEVQNFCMVTGQILPAYRKIKRIIASCTTPDQMEVAHNCVSVFLNRFESLGKPYAIELYDTIYDNELSIDLERVTYGK